MSSPTDDALSSLRTLSEQVSQGVEVLEAAIDADNQYEPECDHDEVLAAGDVRELIDLLDADNHAMSCACGACRVAERLKRWTRDRIEPADHASPLVAVPVG